MLSVKCERGFTLVELLIAVLVSMVVLGIAVSVFIIQNRHYGEQEQIVEMQENARFALQMMTNDLIMAGYDPTGSASVGFVSSDTSAASIRFRSDLDGDGDTTGSNEDVTYAFNSANGRLTRKSTASDTATPMVDNLSALAFTYYDGNGNITADTAEIRKIRIQVTVKNKSGDRTETLTTDVQPRNPALKPPSGGPTVTETTTTTTTTTSSTSASSPTSSSSPSGTSPPGSSPSDSTTSSTASAQGETTTTSSTATPTTTDSGATTTTVPDTTGPLLGPVVQTPAGATVPKNIDVQVCVDVTDVSGVAAVQLQSSLDGFISMANTGGNTYCATIPNHNDQTVVYLITAFDSLSNTSNTFGSYAQTD